ncbi:hypothetical protein BGX38DRAFT_1138974 [Terfezia claveryi]|nr:hypothetical protein BGX38DRAFT_1138974 [Terfezia claveryi]
MADTMDIGMDLTPLLGLGIEAAAVEVGHNTTTEPDDFNMLSEQFMTWLKSRPGVSINPNIALVDLRSENAGRGVISTAPLVPETPFFTLPHSSTLSVLTSPLTTKFIPDAMAKLGQENPWIALVLALLYETRPDSEWKPYIDILPRDFDTLMYWTPLELKSLTGSAVLGKIGKDEAEEEFKSMLGPIINSHRDLFQATELQFDVLTDGVDESSLLSCAHRMASCIMSYSFDIKKTVSNPNTTDDSDSSSEDEEDEEAQYYKAMVPLADLLNADADKNNARLFQLPYSLTMSPLHNLPAQTPLYNDYGPLPRSDLLRRYGYITQNYAQFDVVELKGDLLTETIIRMKNPTLSPEEKLKRIDFLIDEDLLEDAFDLPVPEPRVRNIPSEWAGIYVVLTQTVGGKSKLPSSSSALENIMKTRGYRECVGEILRKRLAMYAPKEEIEAGLASGEEVSLRTKRRVKMAREVREGEIAILEALIKEVEGWIVEEEDEVKMAKEDGGNKRKVGGSCSVGDNRKKARK